MDLKAITILFCFFNYSKTDENKIGNPKSPTSSSIAVTT